MERYQKGTKQDADFVLPITLLCAGFVAEDEHLPHSRAVNTAEFSLLKLYGFNYIILFEVFSGKMTMSF